MQLTVYSIKVIRSYDLNDRVCLITELPYGNVNRQ